MRERKGSLAPLLTDTPEALYWMGFLLADGYFSETALGVLLGEQDADHLVSLSGFLGGVVHRVVVPGYGGNRKAVRLNIMHTKVMKELREKWGIVNKKTLQPPNLSWLSKEELMYVIVGFIDGDGCIKRRSKAGERGSRLKIECHSSWLSVLQLITNTIHEQVGQVGPKAVIGKRGFALITVGRTEVLRTLKSYAKRVPSLRRKWEAIDDDFVSIREAGRTGREQRLATVRQLKQEGRSRAEIAEELRVSVGVVGRLVRDLGLLRAKKPSHLLKQKVVE